MSKIIVAAFFVLLGSFAAQAETLTLSVTTTGGTLSATATINDADIAAWYVWCKAAW